MVFRNEVTTTSRFTEKTAMSMVNVVRFAANVEMFVANAAVFTKNVVAIVMTG